MIYGAYSSEEPNDAFIQGEMNCPSIILGFKTHAARMEFAAMIAQMKNTGIYEAVVSTGCIRRDYICSPKVEQDIFLSVGKHYHDLMPESREKLTFPLQTKEVEEPIDWNDIAGEK